MRIAPVLICFFQPCGEEKWPLWFANNLSHTKKHECQVGLVNRIFLLIRIRVTEQTESLSIIRWGDS